MDNNEQPTKDIEEPQPQSEVIENPKPIEPK